MARGGNVPHALLFTGQDAERAKKTACKFAQWLFHKEQEGTSGISDFSDFCETECACVSCAHVLQLTHPDFYLLDARPLTIGEVRGVIAKFSLAPFISSRKIAVIANAHHMTDAAANALLKILEEPRGNALFILIANGRSSLLATIVSRALEVRFRGLRQGVPQEYGDQRKSEFYRILDMWLLKLREQMTGSSPKDAHLALKQILAAKKMLMTSNVNPELLMEELHVKLDGLSYA
jgi:DNA polymerase III delta prime subunit